MALFALGTAACGPVQYIAQVGGPATSAVAQSQREDANVYAPYEYTSAAAYLKKAREEASRSEFQTALAYGAKAERMANKARALTRERKAAAKRGEAAPTGVGPDAAEPDAASRILSRRDDPKPEPRSDKRPATGRGR